MFSELAPFERDPVTVQMESLTQQETASRLRQRVDMIVQRKGLRELESDYLGMSSYYFEPASQSVWEVVWVPASNLSAPFRKPSQNEVMHLLTLNRLTVPNMMRIYSEQPMTLPGV